ncbi:hypothetical protein MAM1_0122c05886 [Mucor ambiguus]|uniref:Pentacotripeptide-repeat region of PRORP domain-containing protein n=1 Tax=Mucor ambiguus TaxID=91626 RepID=A0A0C9MGI4_9FUNG|nr:hypothetical protein MAM1_0122c05886 [Mucor ambiguus]
MANAQDIELSMRRNKATLIADFYRSLSTQDIDRIWPLYTYLYNNDYLSCLTRKNYHNLFVYTIRSRASQKNLHRLNALVDDMRQRGFSLRLSEYNSLINWVGGKTVPHKHPHHLIDALQLFDEMQQPHRIDENTGEKIEKDVVQPNVATFNSLIHIAAQLLDLRTAQKLYHDMVSRNLQPDQFTYSTLLHAMGKMGDVDGIDRMLEDVQSSGSSKVMNTTIIWNVVMTGYACNGAKDRAYNMFRRMLKSHMRSKRRPLKKTAAPVVDAESFRIYIDMMLHDDKRNEAISTLYSMKNVGVKPIITIYNTLFSSFMSQEPRFGLTDMDISNHHHDDEDDPQRKKNLDTLDKIYQHMKDTQVKPNSETMYTLVSAFLDLGDTKAALEVFVHLSTHYNKNATTTTTAEHPAEKLNVRSSSIATLAKDRLSRNSRSEPAKIEPNPELLERLNSILAKSNV